MNQLDFSTQKEKFKHLTPGALESIIMEYNDFESGVRSAFRATHRNRHLKVPRRNTGRTAFMRSLAERHGTTLSNLYKIIRASETTVLDPVSYKDRTIHAYSVIQARRKRPVGNRLKLEKARKFIDIVVSEVKANPYSSIDETVHDLILNRKDEISGLVTVSTSTIYAYVHDKRIGLTPFDLPRMVRRREKPHKTYVPKRQRGTSIDERPASVRDRLEFGHWEGDLVTGPRDGENGALLTLAERQCRFFYMIPIRNKKSKSVYMAINRLAKAFGSHFSKVFRTITFDNGSEFARYRDIEKRHGIKTYFAHPYRSCERGTNEISNQLVRYTIRKGTDINSLSRELIRNVQLSINRKKRKILGYKSAESIFIEKVKEITNGEIENVYIY